jgi:hypothetical protein
VWIIIIRDCASGSRELDRVDDHFEASMSSPIKVLSYGLTCVRRRSIVDGQEGRQEEAGKRLERRKKEAGQLERHIYCALDGEQLAQVKVSQVSCKWSSRK